MTYIAPELQDRWNQLKRTGRPGLVEALSIEITHLEAGRVRASMPVTDTVKQPYGLLHGGASAALAETVASLGSAMLAEPVSERAAGVEINASHLRPVSDGTVHAEAIAVHTGKRMHVWDIRITDDQTRLVCICRCNVAIIPAP
jgi:1,4-dihydroxy-2-naphthoyl-CoA hydrolase